MTSGDRTAKRRPRTAVLTTLAALVCGLALAGLGFVRARNAGAERQSRDIAVAEAEQLVAEIASAAHKGGARAALARLEALRAALRASDRIDLLELLPSAGRPYLRRYALLATLQGGSAGGDAPAASPPGASPRKSAHDLAERARSLGHGVAQLIDPDAPSADDALAPGTMGTPTTPTPTPPATRTSAGRDGSGGPTVRAAALSGTYALVVERLPAVGPAALPAGTLLICALLALAIALAAGLLLSPRVAALVGAIAAAAAIAWTARAGARAVGLPEAETARVLGAVGALTALAIGVLAARGSFARALAAVRAHRVAYIYLLPAAATTLLLVGVPFAVGLALGFFDHANGRYDFVGIDNFVEILSGGGHPFGDPLNFWFTLGVTLLWTFVNVILHVGMGLGLALLLSRPKLRMRGLYRVLLVLPWAVPNYITALIWRGMFQQHHGAVNSLLGALGLSKVAWFSSFSAAFSANVVTNTWLGFPFMMVVSMGALAAIPKELYEAAAVDGASRFTSFSRITMPLLGPALMPAVILGSIWTFNMFNVIYLVSEGRPGGATDILVTEAYRWAFERGDRYGLAAAYATLIFIVLAVYTLLANRGARRREAMLERS